MMSLSRFSNDLILNYIYIYYVKPWEVITTISIIIQVFYIIRIFSYYYYYIFVVN